MVSGAVRAADYTDADDRFWDRTPGAPGEASANRRNGLKLAICPMTIRENCRFKQVAYCAPQSYVSQKEVGRPAALCPT